MTQYLDNFIYTSSKNGKTKIYKFRDKELYNFLATNHLFYKSKYGFGSNYTESNIKFNNITSALEDVLPHWKVCT